MGVDGDLRPDQAKVGGVGVGGHQVLLGLGQRGGEPAAARALVVDGGRGVGAGARVLGHFP